MGVESNKYQFRTENNEVLSSLLNFMSGKIVTATHVYVDGSKGVVYQKEDDVSFQTVTLLYFTEQQSHRRRTDSTVKPEARVILM